MNDRINTYKTKIEAIMSNLSLDSEVNAFINAILLLDSLYDECKKCDKDIIDYIENDINKQRATCYEMAGSRYIREAIWNEGNQTEEDEQSLSYWKIQADSYKRAMCCFEKAGLISSDDYRYARDAYTYAKANAQRETMLDTGREIDEFGGDNNIDLD